MICLTLALIGRRCSHPRQYRPFSRPDIGIDVDIHQDWPNHAQDKSKDIHAAFTNGEKAMAELSAAISAASNGLGKQTVDNTKTAIEISSTRHLNKTSPLKNLQEQPGFFDGLGRGFAYSAVQAPLDGISQIVDHTAGQPFNTHLHKSVRDLFVKAPVAATFGSSCWSGQTIGSALGVLPWLMLTRSGLRAAEGSLAATSGLVVESGEAALSGKFASGTAAKLVLEGGLTGATHSLLFQAAPQDDNYWAAKSTMAGKSFVTFSTMTASTLFMGAKFTPTAMQLAGKNPLAEFAASKGTAALTGALSALPAAAADMSVDYLASAGKKKETSEQFAKNVYSYAVVGAGLSFTSADSETQRPAAQASLELARPSAQVSLELARPFVEAPRLRPLDRDLPTNTAKSEAISVADLSKQLERLPNAFDFSQIAGKGLIGTLPEGLCSGNTAADNAVFGQLDQLATALRSLDVSLPPQKKSGLGAVDLRLPQIKVQLGTSTAEVSKIGIGEVSHVYKLSVDGHDYAFKVPNDPARMDVHGVYAETAAFTYLAKHQINDLIDFHAASLRPGGGWLLSEFVSGPVARSGVPIADLLSRDGLMLGDDWSANRGPGNVVWDLGGVEPKNVKTPYTLEEFQQLLDSPEGQMIAARKLDGIKNQTELKQALLLSLDHPQIGGQVARTAVRRLTSTEDMADVLSRALETKGAAGRAAFELDCMAGTPYMKDLFYKALANPESRVEASKMIDKLQPEERKAAFDAAFQYPEARAMAAKSIASLPTDLQRQQATAKAKAYPGSAYVFYQTLSRKQHLSVSDMEERQKSLEQYLQSHGLYPPS